MAKEILHEDIAARFIQSEVVDFAAMGKFVAEFGPLLTVGDRGWHGVNFGRYNILACFMPASELDHLAGSLRTAGMTSAVLEKALGASRPV